jgi:transcriptional regulator with XRE-family HTH domain
MTRRCANVIDRQVAARLRAGRFAARISMEKAAGHVGISYQQIGNYENGTTRVSAGRLVMLAELYARPLDWFFEGLSIAGNDDRPDPAVEMLGSRHGARMVAAFLAIEDSGLRGTLVDVAEAMVACSAPKLQAAE